VGVVGFRETKMKKIGEGEAGIKRTQDYKRKSK